MEGLSAKDAEVLSKFTDQNCKQIGIA